MARDATFWDFSLRFYPLPGVASACLRCQDEAGADVNLILFALWHAASGTRLQETDIATADAAIEPWREHVVRPLRTLRRALKSSPLAAFDSASAFRKKLQSVELESERLEQNHLAALIQQHAETIPPLEAAKANLAAYTAAAGLTLPDNAIATLLTAFVTQPTGS